MRGRKPTSVLDRIKKYLDVDISDPNSVRDEHWIWNGPIYFNKPRMRKGVLATKRLTEREPMPPRIRDDNGKLRSVARILHRIIRGWNYPYTLPRAFGCDYRCVNPFHLAYPKTEELVAHEEVDEIAGLVEEIGDFIGANGRDTDRIFERFGLDYSEEEIEEALRRLQ